MNFNLPPRPVGLLKLTLNVFRAIDDHGRKLKAMVYVIICFNYNVMDVVNVVMLYLVIISETSTGVLLLYKTPIFSCNWALLHENLLANICQLNGSYYCAD